MLTVPNEYILLCRNIVSGKIYRHVCLFVCMLVEKCCIDYNLIFILVCYKKPFHLNYISYDLLFLLYILKPFYLFILI